MKNKIIFQKESGSGGISYAMYFIAIVMTVVLYVFTSFNAELFVAESILENGLHIIESTVIASNQSNITGNEREDEFERELQRMKIISTSSYQDEWNEDELKQVQLIGKTFQSALIEQLGLVNNTNPGTGTLKNICGPDSNILIVGDVVIYEPVYKLTVTRTENTDIETNNEPGYIAPKWNFNATYEITGWIAYYLHYNNNVYQGCTKEICTEIPKFYNGKNVEGATIEATLGISFAGLKNIFAGVSTTTPNINGENIDISSVDGGLFAKNPEQLVYHVQVTQAMDIVIADQDSRKVNN